MYSYMYAPVVSSKTTRTGHFFDDFNGLRILRRDVEEFTLALSERKNHF